jgi:hypothetical protein
MTQNLLDMKVSNTTLEIAQDVARKLIKSYLEHNDPLPPKVAAALHQPQRRTTEPNHPGTIARGTRRAIISAVGLSIEEFLE